MIWQVVVVFVFLPIIGQGLKRGEQCTNLKGENAICTRINSCNKATIDELAASAANGSNSDVARALCGFDNEPLICCKTVPDNISDFIESVQTVGLSTNTTVTSSDTDTSTDISSVDDANAFFASIFESPTPSAVADDFSEVNNETTSSITTDSSSKSSGLEFESTIPPKFVTGTPIVARLTESPDQSTATDVLPLQSNENTEQPDESECCTDSDELISPTTTDPASASGEKITIPLVRRPQQNVFTDSTPKQSNENTEEPDSSTDSDEPISSIDSSTKLTMVSDRERNVTIPPENITEPPIVIKLTTAKPPIPSVALDVLPLESNNTSAGPDDSSPSPITESSPGDTFTTPPGNVAEPSVVKEEPLGHILPDGSVCGYQLIRKRLPNAIISSIDEFPWVALLQYQDGNGKDVGFKCEGTLITNRHIITSSHCVANSSGSFELKSVRLGEWSISSPSDCVYDDKGMVCPDKVLDVGVEKIFLHPESDTNIALIRLGRRVDFTDFVRPICLPIEHLRAPPHRSMLTSSGWGTSKSGYLLDIKSKIRLPALSKEKCSSNVSSLEDQFCVDASSKNKICKTDYGAPVMAVNEENKSQWYLEGVIPEGFLCNNYGSVGVYTRVTNHVSWIVSILRGDGF